MSDSIHRIKRISIAGTKRCIVLQDQNGPCPLVALTNTLLLRGNLAPFPAEMEYVSSDWLGNVLAEYLFEKQVPSLRAQSGSIADIEHNIADVVQLLPVLRHGMDVNVGFTACDDYELTAETTIFDAFGVRLLHGWLVDPADTETYAALSHRRYNAAVEELIHTSSTEPADELTHHRSAESARGTRDADEAKTFPETRPSPTAEIVSHSPIKTIEASFDQDGMVDMADNSSSTTSTANLLAIEPLQTTGCGLDALYIHRFLAASPTQLTYFGLIRLHEVLAEREYAVFFRNNHFATITKHQHSLYTLVTDEGLAQTPGIVWERVDDIETDTVFVDEHWQVSETAHPDGASQKRAATAKMADTNREHRPSSALSQQGCTRESKTVDGSSRKPAARPRLAPTETPALQPASAPAGRREARAPARAGHRPQHRSRCGIQ
jgi:hypothetical protein